MVWKLLRKNISAGQIAGYALANLVGLAIVVCAIRFYSDVRMAYSDEDSFVSKDFMIISRPVSTMNTLGFSGSDGFSDSDLSSLRRQPWVRRVGAFTSAAFSVQASVDLGGGGGMSSALFLESIPDEYLDVDTDSWRWQPGQPVPVIISKEYLALYNFGFAATRGLPQISEGVMGSVPLTLVIDGRGERAAFAARIVGFSSRLNTIAVPETFMTWANERFGGTVPDPSRLIVEVSSPGDPAIDRYMKSHGYEVAGDKADNGRASYFLTLLTTVVTAVGAVISLLAFFILTLSILLLLQKNRGKLSDLMMLGYTPWQTARPYCMMVSIVNAVILVAALAVMWGASSWWESRLAEIGVGAGSAVPAVVTAVAIMTAVTAANILLIRRMTLRAFPGR